MKTDNASLLSELKQLADGLEVQGETDAPLEPIELLELDTKDLSAAELLKAKGYPANTKVEEQPLDQFFHQATIDQDWHGDEERATVKRFRALVEFLQQNLKQTRVLKVAINDADFDVYIIGQTPDGHYLGLKTFVTET